MDKFEELMAKFAVLHDECNSIRSEINALKSQQNPDGWWDVEYLSNSQTIRIVSRGQPGLTMLSHFPPDYREMLQGICDVHNQEMDFDVHDKKDE